MSRLQTLLRFGARSVQIALLGTVLLEFFAALHGAVVGLVPDPPSDVIARIEYGVFTACLAYAPVGLVLFFFVGVLTRQNWRVVLERCALLLGIVLPQNLALWAVCGAASAYLALPRVAPGERPNWLFGLLIGLIGAFPTGVLIALWRAVVLLRREGD